MDIVTTLLAHTVVTVNLDLQQRLMVLFVWISMNAQLETISAIMENASILMDLLSVSAILVIDWTTIEKYA